MGNLSEFETYLQHLCEALGHTDRNVGLNAYFAESDRSFRVIVTDAGMLHG